MPADQTHPTLPHTIAIETSARTFHSGIVEPSRGMVVAEETPLFVFYRFCGPGNSKPSLDTWPSNRGQAQGNAKETTLFIFYRFYRLGTSKPSLGTWLSNRGQAEGNAEETP